MRTEIMKELAIDPKKHRLIAVVGAGGKTTLIYSLAKELSDKGYRVAVMTTTHMFKKGRFGFEPLGERYEGEKVVGFSPEIPQKFLEEYDVVLVEADGSKHMSLKVPADHEPVLPEGAELVIGVAGAAAVGKTFSEACQRAELACVRLTEERADSEMPPCSIEDVITAEHVMKIVTGTLGQKKGVACEYRYLINLTGEQTEEVEDELRKYAKQYKEYGAMLALNVVKDWR